jgi:hypothetical protein
MFRLRRASSFKNGSSIAGNAREYNVKPETYESPKAFRAALEDRLNRIAKTEGIDILRLRRQVSFDRLLARFFAEANPPWVLKGGYAMQLRIKNARATKDVDLAVHDAKLLSRNESERIDALLELLRASARKISATFSSSRSAHRVGRSALRWISLRG